MPQSSAARWRDERIVLTDCGPDRGRRHLARVQGAKDGGTIAV